ncbi:MAG: InlB B-repeat-containing protein [Bacteroidales bacterium]
MKHFKKLLFGVCGLMLLSCSTNQHESPISDFLSINIQSPKINYVTKAVTSTPLEDNINHIDIMIFDKNGNIIPTFGKQRFTGSEINGGKLSLRTDKTISPQNFYAVANTDAASINNITTLAQLKALQLTNTAGLTSPFRMVGQHEGVDVNIPSPNVDIQLQRTMARIDIKLVPSISNFELINAEIRNTRNTTFLFPNSASIGSLIDIKNPIQADDTKNHTAKLYSFENNNTNLNDIANSTCIIIGGYYNGDRSKLTYYRLDVLTSDNKAKVDKGVCYTLSVTDVIGKGWDTADDAEANKANNVIYEVKEWVEENNNIIFDGENYIALAQSKLNILRAGGNIELSIQSSDLTKVITEKNGNIGVNSININPSTKKVTLSINPNTSGSALKGNVIFRLGRLSYTLPLYQYAQDITTSFNNEVIFEATGGTKNLRASLSSGWAFRSVSVTSGNNPEWLSLTPNYSDGTLSMTAPASAKSRSCNLHCTFVHSETNETRSTDILVHQNNSNSFYISATTNTPYTVIQGVGEYSLNQNCTLTAPSISGYTFSHWEENGSQVSIDAVYSFTVNKNRTLRCIFNPIMYTISGSATNGKILGLGKYAVNTDCNLTAVANYGYLFNAWTDAFNSQISTVNPYTFRVTSDKTVNATFKTPVLEIGSRDEQYGYELYVNNKLIGNIDYDNGYITQNIKYGQQITIGTRHSQQNIEDKPREYYISYIDEDTQQRINETFVTKASEDYSAVVPYSRHITYNIEHLGTTANIYNVQLTVTNVSNDIQVNLRSQNGFIPFSITVRLSVTVSYVNPGETNPTTDTRQYDVVMGANEANITKIVHSYPGQLQRFDITHYSASHFPNTDNKNNYINLLK